MNLLIMKLLCNLRHISFVTNLSCSGQYEENHVSRKYNIMRVLMGKNEWMMCDLLMTGHFSGSDREFRLVYFPYQLLKVLQYISLRLCDIEIYIYVVQTMKRKLLLRWASFYTIKTPQTITVLTSFCILIS